METQNPASLPVKPEIGLADAVLAIIKILVPDWSKVGIWRPLVLAALAYFGYDNRQIHSHHRRNEAAIEEVKAFVTSPPTNGRRVFESPVFPPLPSTNKPVLIHRN